MTSIQTEKKSEVSYNTIEGTHKKGLSKLVANVEKRKLLSLECPKTGIKKLCNKFL